MIMISDLMTIASKVGGKHIPDTHQSAEVSEGS